MALDVDLREGDAARYLVIYRRREDVEGVLIIAGGDAAERVARTLCVEELARLRGTPSTRKTTRITNLVRARRQVERHALIRYVARRALHNNHIVGRRVTEQGQVRGVRLEGDDARTSLTAGAAPYCV